MPADEDARPSAVVLARKEANRRLLAELLTEAGLDVETYAEPEEAETAAGEGPVSLAMVDVDGFGSEVWAVCKALVAADVSVVLITSSRTDRVQEATLSLGVRSVLEKPLRKANLTALVRTLTGGAT